MNDDVLDQFVWGPNVQDGQFVEGQSFRWESDRRVERRGNVQAWNPPYVSGAASLVFLPVDENDIVALRTVVPRSTRSGVLVHAVVLRRGRVSPLEALALRTQLAIDIQGVESLRLKQGGPPTVQLDGARSLSAEVHDLDLDAVQELRRAIVLSTPDDRPLALVAHDETSIFAYFVAAFSSLPRRLPQTIYFSTLEASLEDPELRLVGVVEQGWIGGSLDKVFGRLIRPLTPSWQNAWLGTALEHPGALRFLQEADSWEEWKLRDAQVQAFFSNGPVDPAIVTSMIRESDFGALSQRPNEVVPVLRTLVESEDRLVPDLLRRQDSFAEATAAWIGSSLVRRSDPFLSLTLTSLSDHARVSFWESVEQVAGQEREWHPGCSELGCPIREAAYARMRSDAALREQMRAWDPRLVPLELQPPAEALKMVLRTEVPVGLSSDWLRGIEATSCADSVLHELQVSALPPDALARNLFAALHPNPRLEEATHLELLSRQETFAFACGPYMRVILAATKEVDHPQELLCRLFNNTSCAFEAWGIPRDATRYLPGTLSGVLSPAPASIEATVFSQAFADADATRAVLSNVLTHVEPQWAREVFWHYRTSIASTLGIRASSCPLWQTPVQRDTPSSPLQSQFAWDPAPFGPGGAQFPSPSPSVTGPASTQSPDKATSNPWLIAVAIVAAVLVTLILGFLLIGRLFGPSEPPVTTPLPTASTSPTAPIDSEATTESQRKEEQQSPSTASPEGGLDAASPAESPAILVPQP